MLWQRPEQTELHNNNNSTTPVLSTFLKKANFNLDIFIVQFGETHRGRNTLKNEVDSFRTGQGTEATGTGSPAHMLNTSATHTVRGGTNNLRRLLILLWWVGINKRTPG